MHELSVCRALLEQLAAIAENNEAHRIGAITLRIGPLAGVEPQLLRTAFRLASVGSVAENASLAIEHVPLRVRCQECGAETGATTTKLCCGVCGDWRTQLISGDELLLESVELPT